jgi:hypothetical protein
MQAAAREVDAVDSMAARFPESGGVDRGEKRSFANR